MSESLTSKQGRYYNSGYCATACGYIVRERGVESWPATFTCSEHADRFVAMMNGDAVPPSAWQPIETAPHDREVLFWVVPLSADETYRDTSGNPITSGEKPRMMFCRFGRWSSLSKAIYWADVPGSPTVTKESGYTWTPDAQGAVNGPPRESDCATDEPKEIRTTDATLNAGLDKLRAIANGQVLKVSPLQARLILDYVRSAQPPADALTLEQLTAAIAYMGCDTDREYTPEAFARDLFAAARQSSTKSEEPEPEHVCDGGWACHFHDVKKAADETSEGQS